MRALCLISVKPGKVDSVVEIIKKKRKIVKQVINSSLRSKIEVKALREADHWSKTVTPLPASFLATQWQPRTRLR